MKSIRRAMFSVAVVTTTLLVSSGMSAASSAQASAPGAPYATPQHCEALPKLVMNFERTILPQQSRDLAAQQMRLREAEAGRAEAEDDFNNALRDGIVKLGTDQIGTARVLRERVRAMRGSGMTTAAREEWLTKIKSIEDAGEQLKRGLAHAEYAGLLRQNQANLVSFMKWVDDTGAADPALTGLANLVAPGIGGVVVGGIKVGLDLVYAGLKGRFTAQQAAQWRENVDRLQAAHQELRYRVDRYRDDLTSGLCGPRVAQQVQNSPRPIPPQTDTAPVTTAPPPTGGGSVGKIVGWTALMGGAIAAGAFAASQVEPIELGTITGSSNTTTTTNNNPAPVAETPSTVGLGPFSCSVPNDFGQVRCEGTVNVRAGTRLAARQGAALTMVTQPTTLIGRFVGPGLGGTTGTVTLSAATFSSLCRNQTQIAFTADGNLFFETIQVSIPVTCR